MALSDIVNKILDDGKKSAKEIKEQGKAEVEELKNQEEKKFQDLIQSWEKNYNDKKESELIAKKQEIRQQIDSKIVNEKERNYNKLWDIVLVKINDLPSDELENIIKSMIDKIKHNKGVVQISEKYLDLYKKVLAETNFEIADKYLNYVDAGFIFQGSTFDIDNTMKTIINNLKEKSRGSVGKVLFKDVE